MQSIYIWQKADWPSFTWSNEAIVSLLGEVRNLQGQLIGRMSMFGLEDAQMQLDALTAEVINSSRIEGIELDADSVRSSVAHHLGLEVAGLSHADHYTDGVVQVLIDAVKTSASPLTDEQLFHWHAALFPTGHSGIIPITVGAWRIGDEPMRVVSGAMGKEKIHYEAPPSDVVPQMMHDLLEWLNTDSDTDPMLKAAIAHLWFISVHPFDDGNGRLARTITDRMLARADHMQQRYYSMSAEIMRQKKRYYNILEQTQKGRLDITPWLQWFLQTVQDAIRLSLQTTDRIAQKATFYRLHQDTPLNERQRKVLDKLWDGFEGNLTTSKWAKINRCSQDTALRDIHDLVQKDILCKAADSGKNTHYTLKQE